MIRIRQISASGSLGWCEQERMLVARSKRSRLLDDYTGLEPHLKYLVQLSSVQYQETNRTSLVKLANKIGYVVDGKRFDFKKMGQQIRDLIRQGIFVLEGSNKIAVNRLLANAPLHDTIRNGTFADLVAAVETFDENLRHRYPALNRSAEVRRLRIAFYSGDIAAYQDLARSFELADEPPELCSPFEKDIFDTLNPEFQERVLIQAVHSAIAQESEVEPIMLEMVVPFAMSQAKLTAKLFSAWLTLTVARGDVKGLEDISKHVDGFVEVDACRAFLLGEYEKSLQLFNQALKNKQGKSKKNAILDEFAGVLHVLLLIREDSESGTNAARAMINVAKRDWIDHFLCLLEALEETFAFRIDSSNPDHLFQSCQCSASISLLFECLMKEWFVPKSEKRLLLKDIKAVRDGYDKLGLDWLTATTSRLMPIQQVAVEVKKAAHWRKWHTSNRIRPLVDLIEPVAEWQMKLNSLASLAPEAPKVRITASAFNERMVWLVETYSQSVSIQPIVQKLSKNGQWTSGRRVALERLHSSKIRNVKYLTEQDRMVCRCIREHVSYSGWRRYEDISYFMDAEKALPALVGHPHVYRTNSTVSLVLVQQQPKLVLTKQERNRIVRLQMDPPIDSKKDELIVVEDTPQRISFLIVDSNLRRLSSVIGKFLDVPESAGQQMLEVAQSLGAVAELHSEIISDSTTVQVADERLHLHLYPVQSGLRGEFFVRPFVEHGPFLKPGQGGENVFAEFDGKAHTAQRDLSSETQRVHDLINDSTIRQQFQIEDSQLQTSSADESLALLFDLQTAVEANQLVLHWPKGESFRLAGHASSSSFRVNVKKDRDWFAASGSLQVDSDLAVDLMQLLDLLDESPSRFIKLDDGRFLALTEQLRRQLDDLSAYGDRQKKKLRIAPVRAMALEELGTGVTLKADQHWRAHVERIHDAENLQPEVPSTMRAELRDYQVEGFQWMTRLAHWGVGACLADDMGLGKTIQALAVLLDRCSNGPALVVAPTSVTFNWLAEAERFAPTLNFHAFGTGDRDAIFADLGPRDVVVTSYGLLYSEAERFQGLAWKTVILDEAQAIKNTATKRSQAAMGLQADMRIIMTGTPLENHLGELWNLFQFINPGLLGSLESFRDRFTIPIEQNECQETRRRLKKLIQPFILRRSKTQVLKELPARTEINLKVTFSSEEATFYEALRLRALEKLAETQDDGQPQHIRILAELMRLRRACCHPRMVLPDSPIASSKLKLFNETIDELLENRHKVLVFSQFVGHLTLLREQLDEKGIKYQYLDGSTPLKKRQQAVESFQAGDGDVFLISLRAGGTGLNLTAADYVIHMDPWWNPAVEDQATDRAHRIGQLRPVTIYRLVTAGTIEEKIVELHATKRDLADSLLEGTDTIAKLSSKEWLNLLKQTD
jgi:SNF2 family DNA or RNA helicase